MAQNLTFGDNLDLKIKGGTSCFTSGYSQIIQCRKSQNDKRETKRPARILIRLALIMAMIPALISPAHADTTFFPIDSFEVAGPIPTPANISDLEGPPTAGTSVTFDPGDLGFLLFDTDLSGETNPFPGAGLVFDIISAVPATTGPAAVGGDVYVSVLLGNISAGPGGGLAFTIAPTGGFVAPDGSASIFEFTQVPNTGTFILPTDSFVAGCNSIGGCNTIVFGTSGLGAAGGSSFTDGGTLTFASVIATSPEPASWALMIIGFLGLAWQMKANRNRLGDYRPAITILPPQKLYG